MGGGGGVTAGNVIRRLSRAADLRPNCGLLVGVT